MSDGTPQKPADEQWRDLAERAGGARLLRRTDRGSLLIALNQTLP